jgi:hypothetical protein
MKHRLVPLLLLAVSLTATLGQLSLLRAADLAGGRPGPTPYDPYLRPVRSIFAQLSGTAPSFQKMSTLLREAWKFEYSFETPYIPALPAVTAAQRRGDCKAKSLWLANAMNDPSVRFIIGKARSSSKISHAWLVWPSNGQWWILDPTNTSRPIAADSVGSDEYIPLYAYDQHGSYSYDDSAPRRRVAGRQAE